MTSPPDSSEIRLLPRMKGGSLCHCTLLAGQTSSPMAHRHVEEIWYVLEGEGEVWRKREGAGPLCILIVTMPPWTGPEEAEPASGV